MAPRKKSFDAALQQLESDSDRLESAEGRALIAEALASQDGVAIARAAKLIAAHELSGHEDVLSATYRALASTRVSADPDCLAKEAVLAALDATGSSSSELFAEAARYTQPTRLKGVSRDLGGRVRARGVLGLARLGHPDLSLLFGAALADADASVRLSAARAVAHRGAREGAGLLLLRLGVGDSEPEVEVECLHGLFAIAPDHAVTQARLMLDGGPRAREQALSALSRASCDEAVSVLDEALQKTALAVDREQVIRTLGLSLRPSARARLLALLGEDRPSDALAALRALAIHRYDTRLLQQVRSATAYSRELTCEVEALFSH